MAFRVPHHLLTDQHRIKIARDLSLKEKKGFAQQHIKTKGKEINFYQADNQTHDIYLPMYYASELFGKPIINQIVQYQRVPPFQMLGTPRDYQCEVIDQSLKNFSERGATFLNVFCSFGKTWVAAYFASVFSQQYGLATLITFHRVLIRKSWVGTFLNQTNAKIYIIGEDQNPPDPDVQIFLAMDTQLARLDPQIRSKIGHFVIDEADGFCTDGRVDALLSVEPMFITALTATYERDDGFHRMLDLLVGKERIVRISKKPFFVFQQPTPFTVEPKQGRYGVIFDSIVSQYDQIEERNSMALQMVMDNPDEKIMILTKHVEHAKNMSDWLDHYLNPFGIKAARLYGSIKQYNDSRVIVGTISKVGIGFDEKEVCSNWNGKRINMLILMSSTKKIEQIAGRVFRADVPVIVDFVDNNKNVRAHWSTRKRWYESRNGVVNELSGRFVWKDVKDILISTYFNESGNDNNKPEGINPLPENQLAQNHAAQLMSRLNAKQLGKIQPNNQAGMVNHSTSSPPKTVPKNSDAQMSNTQLGAQPIAHSGANPSVPVKNVGMSLSQKHASQLMKSMSKVPK